MNILESLVFEKVDQPMTDSLKVAEYFGKDHAHVLRDIKALDCSQEFRESNFGFSNYVTEQRHRVPKINMTFDGFMFLAMGYRGKKAAKLKEAYIAEFNRMREFISVRISAKDDFKELSDAIKSAHTELHSYHFSNEYDLINRIVLGRSTRRFKKENGIPEDVSSIRPYLSKEQLQAISKLQKFDAGLVILVPEYDNRKELLLRYFAKMMDSQLIASKERQAV